MSLVDGVFMEAIKAASKDPVSKFVVVIEEINRGNPAQIFGELLTLLEAGKRTPNEALELCYPDADGKRRPVHIPENFLSKIFQRLATKGLIQSRRGFRGGFRLARPARRITLREIVEALEGPIEFHRCLDHLRARGRRGRCHVRRVFDKLQRKISAILDQTTLEDLLETTS